MANKKFRIWGVVMTMCLAGCQNVEEEPASGPKEVLLQSEIPESRETAENNFHEENFREEETANVVNAADLEKRKKEIAEELVDREYPSVPEHFQKVLRQYEQILRITGDMDYDSAAQEFWGGVCDGDWEYVDDYLYELGRMTNVYYCLADISGDGVPEMIMGQKSAYDEEWYPYILYYYDGRDVRSDFPTAGRYKLTFYTNGLLEYEDTFFDYFCQFQQEEQRWECITLIQFELSEEKIFRNHSLDYIEIDLEHLDSCLLEEISQEEYQRITEQYRTTPAELEWTALWEAVE